MINNQIIRFCMETNNDSLLLYRRIFLFNTKRLMINNQIIRVCMETNNEAAVV